MNQIKKKQYMLVKASQHSNLNLENLYLKRVKINKTALSAKIKI